jgi:hypothetical protein
MTQQMDAFLRDFIGYGQDQITNLDIEWETYNEGLKTGYATPEFAGRPVLVYQAPDGGVRSEPLTEDAYHRCREAMLADIQQLGS